MSCCGEMNWAGVDMSREHHPDCRAEAGTPSPLLRTMAITGQPAVRPVGDGAYYVHILVTMADGTQQVSAVVESVSKPVRADVQIVRGKEPLPFKTSAAALGERWIQHP